MDFITSFDRFQTVPEEKSSKAQHASALHEGESKYVVSKRFPGVVGIRFDLTALKNLRFESVRKTFDFCLLVFIWKFTNLQVVCNLSFDKKNKIRFLWEHDVILGFDNI